MKSKELDPTNYKLMYNDLDVQSWTEYSDPSISVYFNERKKIFLKNMRKLEQKKDKIKILDVGCYTGKTLFELFKHQNKDNEYWGVDINQRGIFVGKEYSSSKRLTNFYFINLDITKEGWGKFLNNKFDLIIFSEVIEHLTQRHQKVVLNELYSLLSEKGIIIITCPNRSCLIKKIIRSGMKFSLSKNYIKKLGEFKGSLGHISEPSFFELKKIVKNFRIIKHRGMNFTYGNEKIGDNTILMIMFLILNKIFSLFLPFWAFDQYIVLKK